MAIEQVLLTDYGKLDKPERDKVVICYFDGRICIRIIDKDTDTYSEAVVYFEDLERAWRAVK